MNSGKAKATRVSLKDVDLKNTWLDKTETSEVIAYSENFASLTEDTNGGPEHLKSPMPRQEG